MNNHVISATPAQNTGIREVCTTHSDKVKYLVVEGVGWVRTVSPNFSKELYGLLHNFDNQATAQQPGGGATGDAQDTTPKPITPTQDERLAAMEMSIQEVVNSVNRLSGRIDATQANAAERLLKPRLGPKLGGGAVFGGMMSPGILGSPPPSSRGSAGQELSDLLDLLKSLGELDDDDDGAAGGGCGHPECEMLRTIIGQGRQEIPTAQAISDAIAARSALSSRQHEALKLIQRIADDAGLKVKMPE